MTPYSQRDSRWKNIRLGNSFRTIGDSGCALVCLAILTDKTPAEINTSIINARGFAGGGLLNWTIASTSLGLNYDPERSYAKTRSCIAETSYYAPHYPQHFFIVLSDGKIIDPLDGKIKDNPYKIRSWRNVWREDEMDHEGVKKLLAQTWWAINQKEKDSEIDWNSIDKETSQVERGEIQVYDLVRAWLRR